MKSICVFCGSKEGAREEYVSGARGLGTFLATNRIGIVYGGGANGLMGAVADGALAGGGDVTGVMPRSLEGKEVTHPGLTTLHRVESMHERKALMADLADGFVALPGGMGTMEEFCETVTWGQLGIHNKPFGLLNIGGYFDLFIAFLDHAVAEGFFAPHNRESIIVETDPKLLLEKMRNARLPESEHVLSRDEI